MTEYELVLDKETERKWRWIAFVNGVAFKFYIPQRLVPQPPPERIVVGIDTHEATATADRANIKSVVEFVEVHTVTIRYAPTGDQESWQIGEPYIPRSELPEPPPKRLYIAVSWGQP